MISDLIVILGGGGGNRIDRGAFLYRKQYSTRILLTGLNAGRQNTQSFYLSWKAQALKGLGVSSDALLFDAISRSSWQEAKNTLKLMQDRGWRRVIIVSDPPHMRRLSWVWGHLFSNSNKEFILVSSPLYNWKAETWWLDEDSAQYVIMEYIKICYYYFTYRNFY